MRIAVFSNLYPPLCLGGYEIGAARVVGELRRRGHEVLVLTAHEYHAERAGRWVCRRHAGSDRAALVDVGPCVLGSLARLGWRAPFRLSRLLLQTLAACRRTRAALSAFRPDKVLLFNPLGVLARVLTDCINLARQEGVPVRAYVSDAWPAEWPNAQPLGRVLARLGLPTGGPPQADQHLYCSRFLQRRCGGGGLVVPWGVADTDRLAAPGPKHFQSAAPLTLLFAGQIEPHKGLDLLLRALARCRRPHRLVVLGDEDTAYAGACKRLAGDLGIRQRVSFAGKVAPNRLPALLPWLGQVLVVPSVWEEPFSLVVLEGMAAGLPVVASDTGGTREAITDQLTGILFDRGRPETLVAALERLEQERGLCHRLGTRARQEVRRRFTIEAMVDRLFEPSRRAGERETMNQAEEAIPCASS